MERQKPNRIVFSCCIFLGLGILFSSSLQAQVIQGRVFLDKNANQVQDKGEKGIARVWVSNGLDLVPTDKQGRFQIEAEPGQSIFPILPSGYGFTLEDPKYRGNAGFYYLDPQKQYGDTLALNFALKQVAQSSSFRIGAIGDIQVDNQEEFSYASRSILQELAQREDLDFTIFLGDLVNDNMGLLAPLKATLETLPMPSWTLVGNHDRNVEQPQAMDDVFNRNFGADTYAFNYGQVHFIVLNNIYATGRRSYEGRISEDQLTFLKNDLQQVDPHTTVVISQHIPMAQTRNKDAVIALLEGFENVLFLSGHTHQVHRYTYDRPGMQELGAGATCGTWWRGEKDAEGIPDAIMQDGTPRGYFVLDFDHGKYSLRFKGVGMDAYKQMAFYTDKETQRAIVNVYGGSRQTQVRMRIDSLPWVALEQRRQVDPRVAELVQRNRAGIYPTEGNTRIPLGNRPSSHIWEAKLPENLEAGMHQVHIEAKDAYGFQATQVFYLEQE